jgi:hypothetical protein
MKYEMYIVPYSLLYEHKFDRNKKSIGNADLEESHTEISKIYKAGVKV